MFLPPQEAITAYGVKDIRVLKQRMRRGTIRAKQIQGVWHYEAPGIQGADYFDLIAQWEKEQATGYHTDRHVGPRGIQANTYGMTKFWEYLRGYRAKLINKKLHIYGLGNDLIIENATRNQYWELLQPNISDITDDSLKTALSNVPIQYDIQNCHFAIREQMWKGVRSFTVFLIRNGLKTDIINHKKPKRVFPPKRVALKPEGYETLLLRAESIMVGKTEFDAELTKTLLTLMVGAGLRRGEVVNLKLEHMDLKNQELLIVNSKGHKSRPVALTKSVTKQLKEWLEVRPVSDSQSVFLKENGDPITVHVIRGRVERLSRTTKIKVHPHALRNTYATFMCEVLPPTWIQEEMGHQDIKTTMGYIQQNQKRRMAKIKELD